MNEQKVNYIASLTVSLTPLLNALSFVARICLPACSPCAPPWRRCTRATAS